MAGRALRDRESQLGQETIQIALAIPCVVIMVFGILQIALFAYSSAVLGNTLDAVAYESDVDKLTDPAVNKNDYLLGMISEQSMLYNADGNLSVTNASFTMNPAETKVEELAPNRQTTTVSGFVVRQLYKEQRTGDLTFTVTYKLPTLLTIPGLDDIRLTKTLTRERVVSRKTEIRWV